MRRLLALGAFSLAGALIGACGDDDAPGPGIGGSGGRGGSSGNPGNGGSSGNNTGNGGTGGITANGGTGGITANGGTGGAGTSGTGGTGGSDVDPDAGDGGGGPPCTGCVELRVPVTGGVDGDTNAQVTSFQFNVNPPADFSAATITFRVRALQLNDGMFVQAFAQDATGFDFNGVFRSLNAGGGFADTDDFIDIVYDLEAVPAAGVLFPDAGGLDGGSANPDDFDKSQILQFGLQVGAVDDFPATTTVTVLIDSVTFDGIDRTDVSFADSAEGFAINEFNSPVPGSEVIHHPE